MAQKQWNKSKTNEYKPIFAAYLNMARHNAYRCLLHISKLMQIPVENSGESGLMSFQLWNKLSGGTPPEKLKIIKLLQKQFPFLQAVFDVEKKKKGGDVSVAANPKEIKRIFDLFFTVLNRLRNEYSHYEPEPRKTGDDSNLIPYLYRCLDGSARETKSRFSITVNDSKKNPPYSQGGNNSQSLRIQAIHDAVYEVFQGDKIRKMQVDVLDKNGKPKVNNKGKNEKEFIDRPDYIYSLKKKDGTLSDMGLVLFICLFLEKRYSAMFLDAIKPWPDDFDENRKKAVLEVFTVFHIRLPKEKFDSIRSEYALGLDMLNELQKCPVELFEALPETLKNKLSVPIHAQGDDVVQDDGVTVKNGMVQMKRMRDRFAPLALQFIDRQKLLDNIRFMVHLGSYRYKFYMKQCVGDEGMDTLRVLQKEINGFGRIDEIEPLRKKAYSRFFKHKEKRKNDKGIEVEELIPDSPESAPYMTDSKAHYLFDGNRVGLRLFENEKSQGSDLLFLPSIQKEGKQIPEGKDIELMSPHAWLSTFELPGLVFYQLLYSRYKGGESGMKDAQDIIKSYITAYQSLFNDIGGGVFEGWDKEKYAPLSLSDLPDKIKQFIKEPDITISSGFVEKSRDRIEEMRNETLKEINSYSKQLSALSNKDNKLRKKGFVDLRPGAIAIRLSRDILWFAPPSDKKQQMTSANFNSLHSSLTLTGLSTAKVKAMTAQLAHPFLSNALNAYKGSEFRIFDFYKIYLSKKADYLTKQLDKSNEEIMGLPFLHATRNRWKDRDKEFIQELAGLYEQFELPRGLFTAPAKELLLKNGIDIKESDGGRSLSMTNLINIYFKEVLKDDSQTFYGWKRHYKVFDMLEGKERGNQLVHFFLSPEELKGKMKDRKKLVPNRYIKEKALNSVNQTLDRSCRLRYNDSNSLNDKRVVEKAGKMLELAYKDYDENERKLRRYAVQDKLMYLMAKEMLLKIDGIDKDALNDFKLKNILPGKDDTILELPVPFMVTLEVDGVKVTIRQKEMIKIKRYGEFYRFNSDTRIRSLIPYLNRTTGTNAEISVDREALEQELSNYDRNRIVVMRMAQSLEQSILSRTTEKVSGEIRKSFNKLLTTVGNIPYEGKGKLLINIRNSFCHNEYAEEIEIDADTPLPDISDTIAKLFERERKRKPESNNNIVNEI